MGVQGETGGTKLDTEEVTEGANDPKMDTIVKLLDAFRLLHFLYFPLLQPCAETASVHFPFIYLHSGFWKSIERKGGFQSLYSVLSWNTFDGDCSLESCRVRCNKLWTPVFEGIYCNSSLPGCMDTGSALPFSIFAFYICHTVTFKGVSKPSKVKWRVCLGREHRITVKKGNLQPSLKSLDEVFMKRISVLCFVQQSHTHSVMLPPSCFTGGMALGKSCSAWLAPDMMLRTEARVNISVLVSSNHIFHSWDLFYLTLNSFLVSFIEKRPLSPMKVIKPRLMEWSFWRFRPSTVGPL